ncbi:MAG TPA: mandelate racemase/muconate lactonizing enzyme family protein [Bryobacteraceae bacterium]|nr:mandelate racemase/muconate lactonizing enzyme family protein [Bryobacteraceae bacterium]
MKITHIETIPVSVPIRPELAISSSLGAHTHSLFLILKVHTDEGLVGLGEVSCTARWSGEDHATAERLIREYLAPELIGRNPLDIEAAIRIMRASLAANPFTKAGVELALWDVLGKAASLPLYRLLGGKVRDVVPLKFSISGASPEKAAELARWALGRGFQAMKVKVAMKGGDLERVRAVREAIGPHVRLGVDANGGWSPREAVQMLRQMAEANIYFAEQPVAPLDVSWMADVRKQIGIPVMADESLYSLQDAMALARAGAADIFSLYLGKSGLSGARKIAAVAEAAGLICTIGSNMELGIASAALIHLALSTPAIEAETVPCDILSHLFYETNLLTEPLPVSGAEARVPEKPGLGVELDEDTVGRYRVKL